VSRDAEADYPGPLAGMPAVQLRMQAGLALWHTALPW
jgi:hypothetical protein